MERSFLCDGSFMTADCPWTDRTPSHLISSTDPLMLNSHRQLLFFWSLLALGLGLRVGAAAVIDRQVTAAGRQFLIEGDANGYWELGHRIASGQEYSIYDPPRRVLRTPGFPLLLAGSIQLFGDSVFAASIVMAFVGCGCCWLTWILARRVTDSQTALWALLLVAVSPLQIGSNVQILSETWFTFWLLLNLIALTKILPPNAGGNRVRIAFSSGLLTGLTVLVRPGWILWAWLSSLIVLRFSHETIKRRVLYGGMIILGCYLALLPWAWRNHSVTGHWIFTSLWSGPSLYDGLHPNATGASDMTFVDSENVFSKMSEFDANADYKRRAYEFAISNPIRTIELAFLKAGRYLSPTLNATGFTGGPFSLFCLVWYLIFLSLMVIGTFDLWTKPVILCLLAGPFVQFLLVHMVFVGSIRYRLPVEFPLSIIAARGVVVVCGKFNGDKHDSEAVVR